MRVADAQVPPQNIEAEESVLGAMLVSHGAAVAAIDDVELEPQDFYLRYHGGIYACARDLYAAGKPIDEISVTNALAEDQRELLAAAGKDPSAYIGELSGKVPVPGNARHYSEIVLANAVLRTKGEIGLNLTNGLAPDEAIAQLLALQQRNAATAEPSSWTSVDLAAALSGEGHDPAPSILARTDGNRLLYGGRLHQVSAEPEAGKGWLALCATAELLQAGATVVYIDFESEAPEIVGRLLALEVGPERIEAQFVYLRPHEPLTSFSTAELDAVLGREPALVIIDGVTEALTIHGLDLGDNADVAKWLELLPRPAARTGAAVLMIDHVVKDKESRGRYSIGAQHKLAGVDVAYLLEVVEPFGRGKGGLVKVKVAKDRPGHVRQHAEGEQVALMRLASEPDSGKVTVTLDPPDATDDDGQFRPTVLMERISRSVEMNPGQTNRDIRDLGGNAKALDEALKLLVSEGYVTFEVEGRAHHHRSIRPFRNDEEGAD